MIKIPFTHLRRRTQEIRSCFYQEDQKQNDRLKWIKTASFVIHITAFPGQTEIQAWEKRRNFTAGINQMR